MKKYNVTMVNPQQIVDKGLKGCSNTRTVMSFAQKYRVPYVWWKPTPSYKMMLVDWPQFRTAWKQNNEGWNRDSNWKGYGSTQAIYGTTNARTMQPKYRTQPGNTSTNYGKYRSTTTSGTPRTRTIKMRGNSSTYQTGTRTYARKTRRAA